MLTSVITGDIIASPQGSRSKSVVDPFETFSSSIWQSRKTGRSRGGDSFQLEVPEIENSLNICIKIKADIRSEANVNARMAIGIGTKTFKAKSITEVSEEAFIRAGETSIN
ncbi:MAG: hypothetical protein KDC80_03205 [Saprospiraceae bacterium]|nr:hypothetical protein [Saprospiraceae bacterium]